MIDTERVVVRVFCDTARADMEIRMLDGIRRGWGDSFRREYTDDAVVARLGRAESHLQTALIQFRLGNTSIDEVRKRAADVANQAFMLADADRLADPGSR